MTVTQLPSILLDANGLPRNHRRAEMAARQELMDLINELPESVYQLGPADAEWILDNVLRRYFLEASRER